MAGNGSQRDSAGPKSDAGLTWSADDPEATAAPAPMASDSQRYELGQEIGRGGLGRVVTAHDQVLDRTVAIKELQRLSSGAQHRFEREMKITAALEHPVVVPVYDAGHFEGGEPFYAMKWVRGDTLEDVVRRCRTFDERVGLLSHLIAVGEAISYAHARGIIHRDLKPQNILVGEFGETMVIDWGLAKFVGEEDVAEPAISGSNAKLTQVGSVVGTPAYMAPEQAAGDRVDQAADVFALGALAYAVFTGRAPYDGGSSDELLQLARNAVFRPMRTRDPDIPPELDAIVAKAMAPRSEDRYPSAAEFTADLKRFQNGQTVAAYSYSASEHLLRLIEQHKLAFALTVFFVLLGVAGGTWSIQAIVEQKQEAVEARAAEAVARAREEARADEVTFEQARLALEHNPARSLSLLRELSPRWQDWEAVRMVAGEALGYGLPRTLRPHEAAVIDLVPSPDGRRVASGGVDRTVVVHDVASGETVAVLEGSPEPIGVVRFSPDGQRVAAASDITGRVWDVATGKLVVELAGAADLVATVGYSPDGSMIAAPSYDGETRIWSADGELLQVLGVHEDAVLDSAFSPDGSQLVTAGYDFRAVQWDLATGKAVRQWRTPDRLQAVKSAPNRPLFAAFGEGPTVFLLDGKSGARRDLVGHDDWVQWLDFNADGSLLATASQDRTVRVWDTATGEAIAVLNGHGASVDSIAFLDDGSLVTAGSDGRVVQWTPGFGQQFVLRGHDHPAIATPVADGVIVSADLSGAVLAWTPHLTGARAAHAHDTTITDIEWTTDGSAAISVDQDSQLRIFDLASERSITVDAGVGYTHAMATTADRVAVSGDEGLAVFDLEGREVARGAQGSAVGENVAFGADGKVVYVGLDDGTVGWLALDSGEAGSWPVHDDAITTLALTPDGRIATASFDTSVRLVDPRVDPPEITVLGEHPSPALHLAVARDGRTVFSAGGGGDVRAWSLVGEEPREVQGPTYINVWLRAGPDGQLAAADAIGGALVWPDTRGEPRRLIGHTSSIESLQWHPDGSRVVTAGEDSTARLWLVDRETVVSRTLRGHTGPLTSCAFSPDGLLLATGGEDGSLLLWEDSLPVDEEALRKRIDDELAERGIGDFDRFP